MTAALEVEHLAVHFGGLAAIADASFAVPDGQIVSLIGPNGAGKTTAFNVVTGYISPTKGRILVHGEDVTGFAPDRIAARGVVRTFQRTSIFAGCTVRENVLMALHMAGKTGLLGAILRLPSMRREERRLAERAAEILEFTGLTHRADHNAGDMAYGEQRLLGLALAMAAQPRLLLLDEPAAGLNPSETKAFKHLIATIRDTGVTVLLVEHDMQMVMSISDTVLVLNQGRIIAQGTPAHVQNDPEVTRAYLGSGRRHAAA
jgi:branched-chain amino acid transport system ATP-binding protein